MFGNVITNGTQVAVGTYGYVASFDLSGYRVDAMRGVQMQNANSSVLSELNEEASGQAALMAYAEDVNCPDFSWCANGSTVFVFCKTATYPYSSASRVAFFFAASPEPITATSDTVIPDRMPAEAKDLLKALTLKNMNNLLGKRTSLDLNNTIAAEKARLGV